jgi:heptosyltransferase-2
LQAEKFDLVLNFEKEMRALALDALTQSRTKRGFALHPGAGTLVIHNAASEYALRLGIDDDLKFRQNTKTMPRILFEMAELPYEGEEYVLEIGRASVAFAERFREKAGLKTDEKVIGLNTGCGAVFPTKQWPLENCVEFIGLLHRETSARVLLLGGVREREFNAAILEKAPRGSVTDTGTENTLEEFIGLIELCDVVVSADSLAMHLAIGRRKPVVALVGPTSAAEIEIYGRGGKIVSPAPCAPCYRTSCDKTPSCMSLISARQVLEAVLRWL